MNKYSPERFKREFIDKLEQGARQPLGGDPFASSSCRALLSVLDKKPEFFEFFSDAQRLKGPTSSTEMANLATVHAINYIMTFVARIPSYPYTLDLDSPEKWEDLVYSKLQGPYADEYFLLLKDNHANTNIPNRGAHLPFLFHTAFPGQQVRICDAGASGNGILGRLAYNGCDADTPYVIKNDTTSANGEEGIVRYYADQPVNFWGVGFDISDMHSSPKQENWFLVNDYIRNMKKSYLDEKRARMERYRRTPNVHFFRGDMTQPHFAAGSIDCFNFSSALYELTEEQQMLALQHAFKAIDHQMGLVVVADRIVVEDGEIVFTRDRGEWSYGLALNGARTGRRWINPIRMVDSPCEKYAPGPDWEEYLRLFPPRLGSCQQAIDQV